MRSLTRSKRTGNSGLGGARMKKGVLRPGRIRKFCVVFAVLVGMIGMAPGLVSAQGACALAERFLEVTRQAEQNQKILAVIRQQIFQSQQQMASASGLSERQREASKEYTEKIAAVLEEELSWDKMKPEILAVICSVYSEQELGEVIRFFESPAGQMYVRNQQLSMEKIGERTQRMAARVMHRIQQIEKEMKDEP